MSDVPTTTLAGQLLEDARLIACWGLYEATDEFLASELAVREPGRPREEVRADLIEMSKLANGLGAPGDPSRFEDEEAPARELTAGELKLLRRTARDQTRASLAVAEDPALEQRPWRGDYLRWHGERCRVAERLLVGLAPLRIAA